MTNEEADKFQDWINLDGATAFHLIERHADNWSDAGAMMEAWLRANAKKEIRKKTPDAWMAENDGFQPTFVPDRPNYSIDVWIPLYDVRDDDLGI